MDPSLDQRLSPRVTFLIFLLVLASLCLFFTLFPDIDLEVQRRFYQTGLGFYLKESWIAQGVYHLVPLLVKTYVALLLICYGYNQIRKKNLFGIDTKVFIFLFGSLALGPGLIVHQGIKDQWGRARPDVIAEFGGEKQFSRFYEIVSECDRNCSFVSGHASAAFYSVAPALLIRNRRKRRLAIAGAFGFGLLVGLGRILQGRHFLSDVLFAGWVTWAVIWLCHLLYLTLGHRRTQQVQD